MIAFTDAVLLLVQGRGHAREALHPAFASGTLAAALPGGVRDAGVRAVDRAEAGLRRWALFVGGAAFLFRVLLWH